MDFKNAALELLCDLLFVHWYWHVNNGVVRCELAVPMLDSQVFERDFFARFRIDFNGIVCGA